MFVRSYLVSIRWAILLSFDDMGLLLRGTIRRRTLPVWDMSCTSSRESKEAGKASGLEDTSILFRYIVVDAAQKKK